MKTKKNYSFSKYIIFQFAIYTLIILGVTFATIFLINWRLNNSFLTLDDFLRYEEKLEYEDYDGIPLSKLPGCDFAIYDENNELIYNRVSADVISGDDLEFISDYNGTYYYNVYNFKEKNNKIIYKIYKTTYDEDAEEEIVVGHVYLNSDLDVIEGDLFNDKTSLTKRELELLNGYYSDFQMVEKYEFKSNLDNTKRTLLFMSPTFTTESYDAAVEKSEKVWFVSVPILLILIVAETILFNRKVKKSLNVLNKVIASYESDNTLKREEYLPKEFEEVACSFENLMKKLKESNEEKAKVYEDKQKVIANLSHDLKTPLTVICGYSKAFLDDLVPNDKKRAYMQSIYDKSLVASDTIDSLFLYAKLDHPDYILNKNKIDLVKFTRNYLAEKYNEIEDADMNLEVDIILDKIMFDIDEKAFRRIYDNLINNSIKYNKKGTTIYFKMEVDDGLKIIVGDDGVGIDKSIKDKLFEPFITSNNARTSGEGNGLGLAIVKNLVEMHKGKIELVKKPRKGLKTEFLMKFEK